MKLPKNKWPKTPTARRTLFLVQLFEEMLSDTNYESFRVPTLDLTAKIDEALDILEEINKGNIPIAALEPIVEELRETLRTDLVSSRSFTTEVTLFSQKFKSSRISGKSEVDHLKQFCQLLANRITDVYEEKLTDVIVNSINSDGKESDIFKAAHSICAHWINKGFDKEFILYRLREKFSKVDIKRFDPRALVNFLSGFSTGPREFGILIPVSPGAKGYLLSLSIPMFEEPKTSPLNNKAQDALKDNPAYRKEDQIILAHIDEMDEYSAIKMLRSIINSISSITFLNKKGVDLESRNFGYVYLKRAASGRIVHDPNFVIQETAPQLSGRYATTSRRQTSAILTQFDRDSTERLLNSVTTAALARSTKNPENQLISLWSAIEVLLTDPPSGSARITHYVDLLGPCACFRYVRNYLVALHDQLTTYHRKALKAALAATGASSSDDIYDRFTRLVLDPTNAANFEHLINELHENPLARFRLIKARENFGSAVYIKKSFEAHLTRVSWQIHRIYRVRNQLVHSGKVPPYLRQLLLNCFEYYRSAIGIILRKGSQLSEPADIDQVAAEICLQTEISLMDLEAMARKKLGLSGSRFPHLCHLTA